MDKELLEQINKNLGETIEKSLPEIVDTVIDKKFAETMQKSVKDIEEVKEELKKMSLQKKSFNRDEKDLFVKTVMVSICKDVVNNGINSEVGFKNIVEKTIKEMSEGTATEGAELVFDQFETDILRVINDFQIVKDVRILPLAKGDKVSLPKATNGITTYFISEGNPYTDTEATTSFVEIDIAKACTLTNMTQELLDDTMTIPDLYDLIVEFIGESQGEFLETQILTGTGSVKGILPNASVNKIYLGSAKVSDDIDDDVLVDVITKSARKFKRNTSKVKFYLSQYVFGKIKALKTADGYPLYPELRNANPTLMGYGVVLSDVGFVQNVAQDIAGGVCMLFGDLSYFTLARRKGITLERGYYGDNWASDIQSLKSNTRYGGKATFPEALTVVINGASS